VFDSDARDGFVVDSRETGLTTRTQRERADVCRWDRAICAAARRRKWLVGRDTEGCDLAQEARVRVLVVSRNNRLISGPYMRRVIANAVLRAALRARPRAWLQELNDDLQAASADSGDGHSREEVRRWANELPRRFQDIYRVLYLEGRTQREAAAILGISQPRVAQLHQSLLERGRVELPHLAP